MKNQAGNGDLDTFDDGEYVDDVEMTEEEAEEETDESDEEGSEEGESEEEDDDSDEEQGDEEEEIDPDSQINLLKDQEDGKGKASKKAKKDEDDNEDEENESDKVPDDGEGVPKPNGKTLKAFDGDKILEFNPDAKVKVKVDGVNQKVPIQELINNYSGKMAYEKKFNEIANEKKSYAQEKAKYEAEKAEISSQLKEIAKVLHDPKANPLDALYLLLDMGGVDSVPYQKKVMETLREEVEQYSLMDDVQKELYWTKKELEATRKSHQSSTSKTQDYFSKQEAIQKVDKMRETYGVSREAYVQAYEHYEQQGIEATPEQVVQYAAYLPHATKATKWLEPFEDILDDKEFNSYAQQLTQISFQNPELSDKEVVEYLKKEFGVANSVNTLKSKSKKAKNSYSRKSSNDLDMFE